MSKVVNLSEAAQIAGKTLNTVKQWASEAGDSWVIERGNKSRPWQIDFTAMQEWRERRAVDEARTREASNVVENILLEGFFDRIDCWREIYSCDHSDMNWPIEGIAKAFKVDTEEVLRWIRMGLPCVDEGDFETGEGFTIRVAMAMDWTSLVSREVYRMGNACSPRGRRYSELLPRIGGG